MGLLIINGDDWGCEREATDAILACFAAGSITSASGMVFMQDSARAAELARSEDLPVGLHLNFTTPFTDPRTPEAVRRRQARLVEHFAGSRWGRWGFSPRLHPEIERSIADQWKEFERLYRAPPTHLDGHEHVHHCLSVLLARTLPSGIKMRPSFTFVAAEKSLPNRAFRRLWNRLIRTRFRTPRRFLSLRTMHPALGGTGLEKQLGLAAHTSVEVMTHPSWPDEHAVLMSDAWRACLRGRPVGSYRLL